jgi:hypothetical protein
MLDDRWFDLPGTFGNGWKVEMSDDRCPMTDAYTYRTFGNGWNVGRFECWITDACSIDEFLN